MVLPFNMGFSTIASTKAANSVELPLRGGNTEFPNKLALAFKGIAPPIAVSKVDGAIVITLMPNLARSRAMGKVRPVRPALLAE